MKAETKKTDKRIQGGQNPLNLWLRTMDGSFVRNPKMVRK